MNIRDIDLNLLVLLDALLQERSVTKAAERVCLSQPAMSSALGRLRRLFDDPLLVRAGRGMELTERASGLRRPVQTVLTQIENALSPAARFEPAKAQRLFTFMMTDYASSMLLPALIARVSRLAPNVALNVLGSDADSLTAIERGEVDFVIDRFDTLPESYRSRRLWTDEFVCVLREGHPALVGGFDLKAYLGLDHILITRTGVGLGQSDELLARRNLSRRITMFTRHYHLPPQIAAESDLCATLPASLAHAHARHLPITVVEPPLALTPFNIRMVWGPVTHYDRAHGWLRRVIGEAVDALPLQRPA